MKAQSIRMQVSFLHYRRNTGAVILASSSSLCTFHCCSLQNITKRTGMAAFDPIMEKEDVELMMHLVEVFSTVLYTLGIPHFLYGGSLLGSYRHHGMIPW